MRKYRIYHNGYGGYEVRRKTRLLPIYQSINRLGKPGMNFHETPAEAEKWLREEVLNPARRPKPVKEVRL